ncbi:unnamed protein product [Camellia sinensis]
MDPALAVLFSSLLSSTIAEASAIAEDHQPRRRRGHRSLSVDIFLHNLSLSRRQELVASILIAQGERVNEVGFFQNMFSCVSGSSSQIFFFL